jgi:hypothetical protein
MVPTPSLQTDRAVFSALLCITTAFIRSPLDNAKRRFFLLIILAFFSHTPLLAAGLSEDLRRANLPTTSAQQLRMLAQHQDWQVREAVAMNRRSPVDIFAQLARDPNQAVRIALSTNLSTPEDIFFILARDPYEQVRSVVARFEYVPASVLAAMADDKSTEIRLEVARNWNTDIPTLKKLSQDTFDEVRSMALRSLNDRNQQKQ